MIMEIEKLTNPGHFPKGVTPSKPKHEPVNRTLSQYMYDIGFIEKYGTGIANVRKLLKDNGNKDLKYELHEIETKAITYSQVYEKKGIIEKTVEKSGQISGRISGRILTERQKEIVELIKKAPSISREELSKRININPSAIQKHINKLKEIGVIKRIGPAKGGYWEIIEK